nr:immunoglobulin heavy chain junction region [Macaca mulatta]MOV38007.1 immunoglobulin heavy chain junction region [Macaca mulatta]MOV38081.1 immunoglobulin heavy chain junction region [Macaca mulatta]MOV38325.1 immunoglobulin heavy chain junction region [Macaca mulatta]MOV38393.1 immunoglobulin heavy chain junction region [Macaca mulatta]
CAREDIVGPTSTFHYW